MWWGSRELNLKCQLFFFPSLNYNLEYAAFTKINTEAKEKSSSFVAEIQKDLGDGHDPIKGNKYTIPSVALWQS